MSLVQLHKKGEMIVHLDKDDNIIALEIPPTTLRYHNIKEVGTKVNNPLCSKGLEKCSEEISLENISYILHCDYASMKDIDLVKVTLDEKSLNEAYEKAIIERNAIIESGYCSSFDPISKKHGGTYRCDLCSLYSICMGQGREYCD